MAKQSKFEKKREYVQYFTMAMSLLYAAYWVVLQATNTKQTGGVHTVGDVILVALVVGGVLMGILYTLHLDKKK